jgi:ABC-type transporter Mla subunit MlaD
MAGIYSPIVAMVTLAILSMQVVLQREINKHQFDQAHIQQARADLEFYTTRLAAAVHEITSTGNTVRQVLHAHFQPSFVIALDSPQLRALAQQLDRDVPQVMGLLFGVFPVLEGLKSADEAPYDMNYMSALTKLTAMLTFETCVTLENFHRTRTEGRLRAPYAFSPLLRPAA